MKIGEGPRAMTLEVVCDGDFDVMELRQADGEMVLSLVFTEDPEAELKKFGAALMKVWRAGFSSGWRRCAGDPAEDDAMKRIQRKRTAGWRMPPGAKYVGRSTKGLDIYRDHPEASLARGDLDLDELRGFDALACWCRPDSPCHADVLIDMMEKTR